MVVLGVTVAVKVKFASVPLTDLDDEMTTLIGACGSTTMAVAAEVVAFRKSVTVTRTV
jgi:hypothetical protein